MTDDLQAAALHLDAAADHVGDAADDAAAAPITVLDTEPIADAIGDASDTAVQLDHEGRLAALEATAGIIPEHTHDEYAPADHGHADLTADGPDLHDVSIPDAPPETTEEPTDEPPTRTHPLLARPFARH